MGLKIAQAYWAPTVKDMARSVSSVSLVVFIRVEDCDPVRKLTDGLGQYEAHES